MIEEFYPENDLLKRVIKYFYVQENEVEHQKFVVFPNIGSAITIYGNGEFTKTADQYFLARQCDTAQAVLHLMRTDPVQITDRGKLHKISIVFHPLGINHFVDALLCDVLNSHDRSYIPVKLEGFTAFTREVFSSNKEKILALEEMLLLNYRPFSEPIVEGTIGLLEKQGESVDIQVISKTLYSSVRTINRLFEEHMCISPVQYRNIFRFRHSLKMKLNNKKVQLNHLALESDLYDASYLIKMYKKFTGLNPGEFFKDLAIEVDNNYIYKIV